MKRLVLIVLAVCAAAAAPVRAQDKVVKKIIETGTNDNRTMDHDDFLANTIGGRLIGSAALTEAEAWVKEQFESWGLEVKVQEVGEINVGFNRGPWSGRMLSDDGMKLHFGTPSYTAGTKGIQRGRVLIEPKNQREFERMKGALKGSWVLVGGKSSGFPLDWSAEADAKRDSIKAVNADIEQQNREIFRYNSEHPDSPKELLKPVEEPALFYREMVEAGVLGFIQSAKLPMQILYDRKNCYKLTMENLPTACDIKLDEKQYDIIYDKVLRKEYFLLEFDIRNHFYRGPVKYHNVIGIMRGSKYPDEYVMCGGHLDAYDTAGGAVDDGNGVSITLESARLLAAAGAKPKRTILFCVWTGEEFGLLGSKYFVENKTVPLERISNYFNRDGGPLCAMGINVPPAMYDDFVKVCAPLKEIDPRFPFTVSRREGEPGPRPTRAGGSDHAYFAINGVPAISFSEQDPLGYNFEYREIWHTDCDTYDKVIPEYMNHSATVTAAVLYGIANLDHLLSREGLYKE